MSINLGIGSRLPAHCTSMGRTLLADMEPAALDALLRDTRRCAAPSRTLVDVIR